MSIAQVDLAGLLPRCLLFPGFLSLLNADESRAEVVDGEDTVKHRWVPTVFFGPVTRVPSNLAKVTVVFPQRDCDVSAIIPGNFEPVLLIVFELRQSDVTAANYANNSL